MTVKLPYFVKVLACLGLFVAGGLIGKAFSLLPNNASALWPPAGLAYCTLLIFSFRQIPLVWLGVFLTNISFFYQMGGYTVAPFDTASCMAASSGTVIQACTGVWLSRRFVGQFKICWDIRQYSKALLLSGPLACVIAPTIGAGTLLASGTIPAKDYLSTWVLWWFGDTFGVLLTSSLILYAICGIQKNRLLDISSNTAFSDKKQIRWHLVSAAILFSMLACTIFAWGLLLQYLEKEDTDRFTRLTRDGNSLIFNRLSSYQNALRGVKGYIEASEFVTTAEWHQYVDALDLKNVYPGILGVGYAAKVPASQTASYVSFIKRKLHPDFNVKRFKNGEKHSGDQVIVQHVEPLLLKQQALGLDLASEPNRRQAAEKTRDTGKAAITNQVSFYGLKQKGFLLFLPVYSHLAIDESLDRPNQATVQERRKAVIGWVYAPLVGNQLFKDIFSTSQPEAVFAIYDGKVSPQTLIFSNSNENTSYRGQKKRVYAFPYAGKLWKIEWFSTRNFQGSPDSFQPQLVLIGGLMLTIFMAILLINLNSTRDRAIRFAQEVSQELALKNDQLRDELAERKKFEAELQKSKDQLNLALVSTNDGLWDWNIATGEAYFSQRWLTMLGYEPDDIKPHFSSFAYLLHPEDEPYVSTQLQAHLDGKILHYQAEIRMHTKSGDWKWILTRGQVVERDELGRACRMVGTHTDITERKQIDESLKNSEERLKQAIFCSAQGLWDWNIETDEIYIDQSWFDLFGFDSQKASRSMRTWQNTVHHEDLKNVVRGLNRHFKGVDPFCDIEYRQLNGKGQWIWVCSRGRVVGWDESGKPIRMIGTTQDVTSRKKMENTLMEAIARAEQANLYKSNFLANMSHEIRTPMNGILGMTEITLNTELTGNQRNYLEMVYSSAQSLLTIINDILDFSKIEAGKLSLEPIPFDLQALVDETLYPMEDAARKKRLALTSELSGDIPEILVGDPTRLRQVLNNLLSNALKFTEEGEVKLGIRLDKSDSALATLHFWVSDTGIGLNEEQQKRIFDPFTQADNSTSRKFGGTGLGLSISTQLVEMMQGKLWVVSEQGKGSIFHFTAAFAIGKTLLTDASESEADHDSNDFEPDEATTVKQADPAQNAATGETKPAPEPGCFAILLAEDNAINQAVAAHLLQEQGHQVQIATNGKEALNLWESEPFDLILMDMHMPEMDGVEATQHIREQETLSGGHIPIIAVTASALKGDQERCLKAGMDDYVSKPYRKEELVAAIQRIKKLMVASSGI